MRHVAFQVDRVNFAKAQEALQIRGIEFVFRGPFYFAVDLSVRPPMDMNWN